MTGEINDNLEESMMEDLMEAFLPKILPKLEPAFKKLAEYLMEHGKQLNVQVNPADGSLHLMVIKTSAIEEFKVSDEDGAVSMYPVSDFLRMLMDGDFEQLMAIAKEEAGK